MTVPYGPLWEAHLDRRRKAAQERTASQAATTLEAVRQEPGASVSDLAQLTGLPIARVSETTRLLEDADLVRRDEDAWRTRPGRRIHHHLTLKGRVFAEMTESPEAALVEVLA